MNTKCAGLLSHRFSDIAESPIWQFSIASKSLEGTIPHGSTLGLRPFSAENQTVQGIGTSSGNQDMEPTLRSMRKSRSTGHGSYLSISSKSRPTPELSSPSDPSPNLFVRHVDSRCEAKKHVKNV